MRSLVALTKPRIIELLLVTTLPTMLVANRNHLPSATLVLATLFGGMCAAGGANALNMYVDRDIDRVMQRTRHRPLVTGAVTPRQALLFALGLEVVAFVELTLTANLLSAVLAASAAAFYIGVYTLWLKRTSRQNIVIGGAAGAVPVLVGWAAVTGRLGWAPVVLFAVIFLWTPPHFWALAVKYRDDYQAAGVPMMPAVVSVRTTARSIVVYSVLTVAASLLVGPAAGVGVIYTVAAPVLGAGLIILSVRLYRRADSSAAMHLFAYSISYLTLLFCALAFDRLLHVG
ncbi:heme o synthase [Acidiferrimicrobium sp. IK]|uniref:heme o synthase n=1 Tax=Acidiferrimicrobium sp. IK TaxID=2871700 RepID=UPI0021CB837B|nr:heme o synthase [Acidiferrimicrobium sp. IK]